MINVIIPTYKHPWLIDSILKESLHVYSGDLFVFEIHDSSPDKETEGIVKQFIESFPDQRINYYRYPVEMSVDDKVLGAIKNTKEEYFYLMGDGNLVDFNELEQLLIKNNYKQYGVIDVEHTDRKQFNGDLDFENHKIISFQNATHFISKYFSHMTYWGATIVDTTHFHECWKQGRFDKYFKIKNPWWIACCETEMIGMDKINGAVLYSDVIKGNPLKNDHSWTDDEKYYEYTFRRFNEAVGLLPDKYNDVKQKIISVFRKDSLVTYRYVLDRRINGVVNIKRTWKYRKDIMRIHGYFAFIFLASIIPTRMLKLIRSVKRLICGKERNVS